jgi:hypothetical protein
VARWPRSVDEKWQKIPELRRERAGDETTCELRERQWRVAACGKKTTMVSIVWLLGFYIFIITNRGCEKNFACGLTGWDLGERSSVTDL